MGRDIASRSVTLLLGLGDVTITWDASSDADVEDLIRSYLADGVRFYILERPSVDHTDRQRLLTDLHRKELVDNRTVEVFKLGTGTLEFVRSTRDVNEIVKRHTAAVPASTKD